jgi:environmental stress-induced protein Ves
VTLLRAADRTAVPWKNGGGVTREVAAWPPGAGFDDFAWRVSMAEVRSDGPFSMFPGVDRILAVLEGRLVLSVEGQASITLAHDTPPAAFPGDAPTTARVESGPVLDLNVMTRRGGGVRPVLRRIDAPDDLMLEAAGLTVAIGGGVRVENLDLGPLDAALLAPAAGRVRIAPAGNAFAYMIAFHAL